MTFNPNLFPDGGWRYLDANGVKHVASSYNTLIAVLTDYRKRNGMPAGDPAVEITTQLCARNPGFCRDSVVVVPQPSHGKPHLGNKILDWISRMVREKRFGRLKKVSDSEALRRAEICARCPKQTGIPLTCGKCIDDIARLRVAILEREPIHKGIGVCPIFEDDLQTIVHFETGKAPNSDIPRECWRKEQ